MYLMYFKYLTLNAKLDRKLFIKYKMLNNLIDIKLFVCSLTVLSDVMQFGELLLALHIGVWIGQHDIGIHRNQGFGDFPWPALFGTVRIDGTNDHEQELGGLRTGKVSS